jgi:hypothetical protein
MRGTGEIAMVPFPSVVVTIAAACCPTGMAVLGMISPIHIFAPIVRPALFFPNYNGV